LTEPLQQELDALDQFIALLRQEQAALVRADALAVIPLADHKLKLSEQLNALARRRVAMLAQSGFAADTDGMRRWLTTQPAAVATQWEQLLDKARTAQHLNQTNGKLIETQLQHNQQALSALMHASNQAGMYGPDGQPRIGGATSPRSMGKA
jgi:flagella synthesis protein FlgN